MLVLTRRPGEECVLLDDDGVQIGRIVIVQGGHNVKIGLDLIKSIRVLRPEMLQQQQNSQQKVAKYQNKRARVT